MEGFDYDCTFKVVLLGDPCVGKTDFLLRFRKNEFDHEYKCTVGVGFGSKFINVNDKIIKAHIWDTCGDERYRVAPSVIYDRTLGALILYDITRKVTFQNVEKWLKEVRDHTDQNIVIMLVGNKADLRHQREVQTEEAKAFSEREKILFMEASALESLNVENAFTKVLNQIYHDVNNKVLVDPVAIQGQSSNVRGTYKVLTEEDLENLAFVDSD